MTIVDAVAEPLPRAVVDLAALRRNVATLTRLIAPAETMLAVKADAYGHGLLPIAEAGVQAGATSLAVLEISAGLVLRRAGVTVPLLAWLHGTGTDWRAGIENDIQLGISARWQLEAIAAAAADRAAIVHLKVDTGLSRNGATREEWPALVDAALALQETGVVRLRAAWSHLADASIADDEAALAEFREAVAEAEARGARFEMLHLAASSAGIRMPEARFALVRFGIAAYGLSPFDDTTGAELGLRPVMRLEAPVIAVHVDGTTHVRLGIGFADGVPTLGLARTSVLLGGRRCPVIAVEADAMLVDAGAQRVERGDTAVLFGPGDSGEATAEEYAEWAGTIADEMVTGVAARVPRVYVGDDEGAGLTGTRG
ncbi:alanine racemase [Leifsonia xyli subsp. xyli]|uniref:Alanine racemase n=2 Tax=Leifsonia xyli subsp. xyli TaxID=59736 RepID=Q6AFE9_LEIXX|nr:alanine racemase [Leifsonia xyli]AAT88896.1 alanine racemase [Leifsonia xyli subsp. xyli str. CTCB07]ODA90380.1 alanine racemase [Leifsonia xyli subsp. xyli]